MKILKRLILSFAMYSRIPVPVIPMEEEDMAVSLTFFPLVGAVIGLLTALLNLPEQLRQIPAAARILLTVTIPILVTGGFHLDGFMDTEDALRSYASTEKRLEILKDPHIGAFAVIGLIRVLLLFGAAVTCILLKEDNTREIIILSAIYVTARSISALAALFFKKAKRDGMLVRETENGHRSVAAGAILFLVLSTSVILCTEPARGLCVLAAFGACLIGYRIRSYRIFGGVTGDTAGHFLVSSETAAACALALASLLFP
ncbi:MAG: adenosylcobinamide-GDP ribazoletransferase [Lachnospiraceae bacterium]|nr:adenosylcobinamide-GDP ribazoletransferase [Lachnospiraceae bacterium]